MRRCVQPLGLLLDIAGETLRERLFVVQGNGGAEACLRTDFTLPALSAHLRQRPRPPGRYFYAGHAFRVAPRGQRPGRGVPADRHGGVRAAAMRRPQDAEVAALAWRSAPAGGRQDLTLLFGDVGLFGAFHRRRWTWRRPWRRRLKRAFSDPRRLRAELEGAAGSERPTAGGGWPGCSPGCPRPKPRDGPRGDLGAGRGSSRSAGAVPPRSSTAWPSARPSPPPRG